MRIRIVILTMLVFGSANAQTMHGGVIRPDRLTAGASNQFMGVPDANGHRLYFITDRHSTYELYGMDAISRAEKRLVDTDADVTGPMVSKDGRYLLFISFRRNAGGDVCVKDLQKGGHWCVTGPNTSALQAFFFPDNRIGVIQRTGLNSDLQLVEKPLRGGSTKILLKRNITAPAISPDGEFLTFVPIERFTKDVGVTFAVKAGLGFVIRSLSTGRDVAVTPRLPGRTSFPVFARDGKHIYFTQYLNDTNRDGVIDGNDNGVIFRVPFDAGDPDAIIRAVPEQLTSAAWDCQYPHPAKNKLFMTCARDGSLDIYSMPLTGAVPGSWGIKRLWQEIDSARDDFERLLLLRRASNLEKDQEKRLRIYRRMANIHLDHREFESAKFYIAIVRKEAADGVSRDWADVFSKVLAHRVTQETPNQDTNIEIEREKRLAGFKAAGPDGRALADLARVEVLDDLGRDTEAKKLLRGVNAGDLKDFATILYAAQRFEVFYFATANREKALKALAILSKNKALKIQDRLFLADRFTDWLVRGRPARERRGLIKQALKYPAIGTALKYRLKTALLLLDIGKMKPEEVRKRLFSLYKSDRSVEMRKVLVQNTASKSADKDQEYLLYQFSNSWVSFLKKSQSERKYAEDLYRETVLERAYNELAKGNVSNARGAFFGVTLQTDSLEAHVGFIEAMFREGKDPAAFYNGKYKARPDAPINLFAHAYLAARQLKDAHSNEFKRLAKIATDKLIKAVSTFDNRAVYHQVFGFVAHQRFLRSHDTAVAAQAIAHYLLALDLGRNKPRILAPVYLDLGLLQTALGNYGTAITDFRTRLKYPFLGPETELATRLGLATCLFMTDKDDEAARAAKTALGLVRKNKKLSPYLKLVLDRTALYSLSAKRFEQALKLYGELEHRIGDHDKIRSAKLFLATGSTALGAGKCDQAVTALKHAQQAIKTMPALPKKIRADWGGTFRPAVFNKKDLLSLDYALISKAYVCKKQYKKAMKNLRKRLKILKIRTKKRDLDTDFLDIANTRLELAIFAFKRHDTATAITNINAGIRAFRQFAKKSGTGFNWTLAGLVDLAARMNIQAKVPMNKFSFDLRKEVKNVFDFTTKYRNPKWAAIRYISMLYSTVFNLNGGKK